MRASMWLPPDSPGLPRARRWRRPAPRRPDRFQPDRGAIARTASAAGVASAAKGANARKLRGGRRAAPHERFDMSVSTPFILRPIATSLLGIAVMLGGAMGYMWLPVA